MTSLLLLALAACGSAPGTHASSTSAESPAPTAAQAAVRTVTLAVDGMTCASCSLTVRAAAGKLDGVQEVKVDVDAGRAVVTYDPAKGAPEQVAARISEAGYPARVLEQGS